ncbi:choice-of-anchor A family protein [Hyalangium rubrum]|uniref:Choice-of-anchor A family protein n=1 Tax=Hyalangium rubrum TaxID=3103134 RepID=A0ABU5H9V2_9BACT|nr:choice-of-anchor A family protein [Hyalangium sp. s54d21]MDY7230100.1 choice-of-anchor A family protein [Hyalangium sp. s54d21]
MHQTTRKNAAGLLALVVACLGLGLGGCGETQAGEQALSSTRAAVEITSGPIFLTGHDPDFHAQDDAGARRLLSKAVTYVRHGSTLPMLWVESRIAVPSGHRVGKNGLIAIGLNEGSGFIHANGAQLAAQSPSWWQTLSQRYSAIGVASDFGGTLTQAELDVLNAHKADIATFVNGGGGLLALAEGGGGAGLTQRNWFKFLPIEVVSTGNASPPYTVSAYGQSEFGLLDSDVNSPSHSHFTSDFGLNVVTRSAPTGQIMTLAGKVRITDGGFLVANAGPDQTLDATAWATPVTLNGSGSSTDDAGAPLQYRWQEGTLVLADTASPTTTVMLSPGVHTITLVVTNSRGETASDTVVITIRNTQPPSITCPESIVKPTEPGLCSAQASFPAPVAQAPVGGATVSCDHTSGSSFPAGVTPVICTVTDRLGNTASCTFTITVRDEEAPTIIPPAPTVSEVNGTCRSTLPSVIAASHVVDNCASGEDLTLTQTPPAGTSVGAGTHIITLVATDEAGNSATATTRHTVVDLTPPGRPCGACFGVRLSDYNLFVLNDYTQGTDVQGKVAAGGNIRMNNFSVGVGLADGNTANALVAGGNLTLSNGAVWGDAWHGGSLSANSVTMSRGTISQGSPIDFVYQGARLRVLSSRLANLPVNGTTVRESWGGVMLRGTDPNVNVFQVPASAFTGAVLLSIDAPGGSLAVINISGSTATFSGLGHSFAGGIDQRGVLFNFVDTAAINANGIGFWGTLLAPYADVRFSNGSFDGGLYARSMTGYAEGHINPLNDRDICQ